MINLIIKDGLGNQLFQYAYARHLQHIHVINGIEENDIAINPFFINHTSFVGNEKRQMSLQHFVLHPSIRFMDEKEQKTTMKDFKVRTVMATGLNGMIRWKIRGKKLLGKEWFEKRAQKGIYYTYMPYTSYKSPLSRCGTKHVFGFFQSEKNFHDIGDDIRKELQVKTIPSSTNKKMIEKIKSCNAVCLHVRRGDYLNEKWRCLQICDFEYYNNAVNVILERTVNPTFFIFSNSHDDLVWIRNNYHFYDKNRRETIDVEYVDLDNPDYEELRLMYNCKHFIISNSTFSWWAAYLSNNDNKIVCAPSRWNLAMDNDDDIYLDGWIKVNNEMYVD